MMFACYAILEIGFLLPHTSHCCTIIHASVTCACFYSLHVKVRAIWNLQGQSAYSRYTICFFTTHRFLRFVISTAKNTCYNIYKRTEDSLWRTRNGFYLYTGSIFIGRAVRSFWTICYRSIVISFAHRQAPVFTVHMPRDCWSTAWMCMTAWRIIWAVQG